jgi:hypothetical protein
MYFWGEKASNASGSKGSKGRPARRKGGWQPAHPFAVEAVQLRDALPFWGNRDTIPVTEPDKLVVVLPSTETRPVSAPAAMAAGPHRRAEHAEAAERGAADGPDASGGGLEPVRLSPWTVEAAAVFPARLLDVLLTLPEMDGSSGVLPAADVLYWGRAARFALDLLERLRIQPGVEIHTEPTREKPTWEKPAREKPVPAACWRPVLNAPEDAERLAHLGERMPPVCRMAACPTVFAADSGVLPRRGPDLLTDFLQAVIDATVRRWLAEAGGTQLSLYHQSTPAGIWMAALGDRRPLLKIPKRSLESLTAGLAAWQGELTREVEAAEAGFRTCLRLVAPEKPGEPEEPAEPGWSQTDGDEDWRLEFFLQAVDDPSLLVPAEEVWNARGRDLEFLQRRFVRPQERLLADLGLAAQVFPPLDGGLRTARPAFVRLSIAEAYDFICTGAARLQEQGFVVQLPPWCGQAVSPGLHLKLRPPRPGRAGRSPAGGISGLLSMESVVECDWELALGGELLDREEFARLAALKVPLVRLRGRWVELAPETVPAVADLWRRKTGAGRMKLAEALRYGLSGDAGRAPNEGAAEPGEPGALPVVETVGEGWVGDLLAQLTAGERPGALPVPAGFQGVLRAYQERGFSWLCFLEKWGLGACLADDMGLGKTIQFLVFLLRRREQGRAQGPSLLVCPTSVVGNWEREAARFAPGLRVLVHHGPQRLHGDDLVREAVRWDLVVSTYGLVVRDHAALARVAWDGIVLDEAQHIKNAGSKQARHVGALASGYRLALTGTPVENRLSELWSISNFLNPGYLGSQRWFQEHFARPIERDRDAARTARLRRLVAPFILRRLKTDPNVAPDLPEKQEQKVFCHLTPEQGTLYAAVVADMLDRIDNAAGMERRGLILATLGKLKQLCNHPVHLLKDGGSLAGRSGKLNRLEELLDEALATGDRALVFTQFREMGALLRLHLERRFGREVLFLHGGVQRRARDEMVARFQDGGPPLFILSLKAGGTGLNLTAANHVFHFDRWWNPAVENQATDRAFRIGQQRNVLVHKFVCVGTVEEKIDLMIEQKTALAAEVIGSGEDWVTELSTAELHDLFQLRAQALAGDPD